MKAQSPHWPSVWQFALSALAVAGLWSAALGIATLGLISLMTSNLGQASAFNGETLSMLLLATAFFTVGCLCLPSAIYSLGRLAGWRVPDVLPLLRKLHPGLWIFALPVVLLAGHWAATRPELAWLLLPPLHILAVMIPLAWLAWLALRRLPLGSAQRVWGALGSGMVLAPLIILLLEGAAALVFLVWGVLMMAGQPGAVDDLTQLAQWLDNGQPTQEMILERLSPYLFQPGTAFIALAFGAVVVPLIEEVFKPAGVWLLAGRSLSARAGFVVGALGGAGYAVFESLALASSGEQWAGLVSARIGTGLVHIVTAALTGWAMARAWKTGRYWLLGVAYLTAVTIHSLWNGLTLFYSFTLLAQMQSLLVRPAVLRVGEAVPAALVFLALACLVFLVLANRSLVRQADRKLAPEVVAVSQPGPLAGEAADQQTENML